jgi:hypothetical protein
MRRTLHIRRPLKKLTIAEKVLMQSIAIHTAKEECIDMLLEPVRIIMKLWQNFTEVIACFAGEEN